MMRKLTWYEFSQSGKLWFVNRILAAFGLAIVFDGENAYPADIRELPLENDAEEVSRETFLQGITPIPSAPRYYLDLSDEHGRRQ